ncbi:uncharacterized protein PG986_008240 [Apiospora aurea]|uniref:ATP-dependent DNA helicase n=1 Tax=Apiospora aurea TaxID=335848 RepID=A0ABR1QEV8_9PEZI
MSSSPIPDLEEDNEVVILDSPVQPPHNDVSQHHPRPGQRPAQHNQTFYTPATSGPLASVWPPVPAPVLDSCQGYGERPSLPLHPMQFPQSPVGQDLTVHHQLPTHAQALTPATVEASRKTKRNAPSPSTPKRRRLNVDPGSAPSGFRHEQPEALLPAEASTSAATTSAEYKSGSRDTEGTGFPQSSSPPRAPTQGEIQGPSAPQSPSKEPPPPPATTEPALCPEQAALVDLICSGRNVFYTGSAGCGKSTVLRAFTKRLRDMDKKVHILAPTGRAALQVNGTTTWTYAGWTPDSHKRPYMNSSTGRMAS